MDWPKAAVECLLVMHSFDSRALSAVRLDTSESLASFPEHLLNHAFQVVGPRRHFANFTVSDKIHKSRLARPGLQQFGIAVEVIVGFINSCNHPYLRMFRGGHRSALQAGWSGLGRHACSLL